MAINSALLDELEGQKSSVATTTPPEDYFTPPTQPQPPQPKKSRGLNLELLDSFEKGDTPEVIKNKIEAAQGPKLTWNPKKQSKKPPLPQQPALNPVERLGRDIKTIGKAIPEIIKQGPKPGEIHDRLSNIMTRVFSPLAYLMPGVSRKELIAELDKEAEGFSGFGSALAPAAGQAGQLTLELYGFQRAFGGLSKVAGKAGEIPRVQKIAQAVDKMGGIRQFAEKFPRIYQGTKNALKAFMIGDVIGTGYGTLQGIDEGTSPKEVAKHAGKTGLVTGIWTGAFSVAGSIDRARYIKALRSEMIKRFNVDLRQKVAQIPVKQGSAAQVRSLEGYKNAGLKYIDNTVAAVEADLNGFAKGELYPNIRSKVVNISPKKAAARFLQYGYETGKIMPKAPEALKTGMGTRKPTDVLAGEPTTRAGEVLKAVTHPVETVKGTIKEIRGTQKPQAAKDIKMPKAPAPSPTDIIPPVKSAEKEIQDDSQKEKGMVRNEPRRGEEPRRTVQVGERGEGETPAGGILQTQERVEIKDLDIEKHTPMDLIDSWDKAIVEHTEKVEAPGKEKIDVIQKQIDSLKGQRGKEVNAKRKELKTQIDDIKKKIGEDRERIESVYLDRSIVLQDEIIERAEKAGVKFKDDDEKGEFAADVGQQFTERPYIEHNYKQTLAQIIDDNIKEQYGIEPAETVKQPYEMTKEEWDKTLKNKADPYNMTYWREGEDNQTVMNEPTYGLGGKLRIDHWYTHKEYIQKSLSEGKTVPAEVLAEYPELGEVKVRAEEAVEKLPMTDIPSAEEFGKIGAEYRKYLKRETDIKFRKVKHPHTGGTTDRPYVLGFGCDGCGDTNVHYVAQKMVQSLGWDYAEIYNKAYPDRRGDKWIESDFSKKKDEALKSKFVKDTTIIPENSTVQTVLDELYDINNRSLVAELEERFENAGIPFSTKLKDLKPQFKGKPVEKQRKEIIRYTNIPEEWLAEDKLVDWGKKGFRTPGNRKVGKRKSFPYDPQNLTELPTRLPRATMDRIKELAGGEFWAVSSRRVPNYYFAPKKVVELVKTELGEEAFERIPKKPRTAKQLINDAFMSMKIAEKNNQLQDHQIGENLLTLASENNISEDSLPKAYQEYIIAFKEYQNEQDSKNLAGDIQATMEQPLSTDTGEEELDPDNLTDEQWLAIQNDQRVTSDIDNFLDDLEFKLEPTEVPFKPELINKIKQLLNADAARVTKTKSRLKYKKPEDMYEVLKADNSLFTDPSNEELQEQEIYSAWMESTTGKSLFGKSKVIQERPTDLLGTPILRGGASGKQKEMFSREDFKTEKTKEQEESARLDTEGQAKLPAGGAGGSSVAAASTEAGSGYGTIAPNEKSTLLEEKTQIHRVSQELPEKAKINILDELLKIASPAHRGGARSGARVLRKNIGKLSQETVVVHETLKKAHRAFTFMNRKDIYDFIDRMENGQNQITPRLTQISQKFRKMLDERRDAVQALGKGQLESFYTNYFPHIWKDPKAAEKAIMQIFGKRRLEGSKSFLKKRTIMTVKEGRELGLELVSENPVDLVLLKLFEMDRYLMAQNIIKDMKAQSLIRFVYSKSMSPDGYKKIDDRAFTVYMPPEITKKEAYDSIMIDQLMDIARSLGIDAKRFVAIGGKRWGFARYDLSAPEKSKMVRTRYAGPESVLAHEIGHILGFRYNLFDTFTRKGDDSREAIGYRKTINVEWRALADARVKNIETTKGFKKYVRKAREKEAVMLEALIHAPDEFKKVAPTLYKIFKKFINDHSELRPLLDIKPSLVLGQSEAKIKIPGFTVLGHYYAPEPVAKILNNYLSPGLRNNENWLIGSGYNMTRQTANIINQAQLALSGFHALNVTTDMMASTFGQGLRRLTIPSQMIRGVFDIISTPISPAIRIWQGVRLRRAYKKQLDTIESEDLRDEVKAVILADGRDRMDPFYYNHAIKNLTKTIGDVIHGSPKQKLVGVAKIPYEVFGSVLEVLAKPLMEWYVPTGKLGLFAMMAQHEFKRAESGHITAEQLHERLISSWDSVDNRMGQLIYDNLFWNKILKDVSMLAVRSVGWNLGSWREFGGVGPDIIGTKGRLERGDKLLSQKMAYTIGAVTVYAVLGAVIMYLLTGKSPEELKDYFFPKTGNKNSDGSDERLSLPTYVKDWWAYGTQPVRTLKNKLHPLWSRLADLATNKDFFNTEIRHPKDPLSQQLLDTGEYAAKTFIPLSIRNYQKMQRATPEESRKNLAVSITGIISAPGYITRSPAQKLMYRYIVENIPQRTKTQEQQELYEYRRSIKNRIRKGGSINEQEVENKIGKASLKRLKKDAAKEPFAEAFSRLSPYQALNVYTIASQKERAKTTDILKGKYKRARTKTEEMETMYKELIK